MFIPRRIHFVKARLPRNRGDFVDKQSSIGGKRVSATQKEPEPYLYDWPASLSSQGRGLSNLGNTCFMNSVLQCLTHLPPVLSYLMIQKCNKCRLSAGSNEFCALCLFKSHIIEALHRSRRQSFSPTEIARNLRRINKSFRIGRQEDAHEFFKFFLESMSPSKNSTESKLFQGELLSQVVCGNCGHNSRCFDPFLDLSVSVSRVKSLEQALSQYCKEESLSGDNMYKCEKCRKRVNATKSMRIHKTPPILTVQLKRFEYSRVSSQFGKIDDKVAFQEKLNLMPWMSDKDVPLEQCSYSLRGIVVHHGSGCRSGHYVAFVKSRSDVWYHMDDQNVSKVGLNAVLNMKPYILFYVKDAVERPKVIEQEIEKKPSEKVQPDRSTTSLLSWNLTPSDSFLDMFNISTIGKMFGSCSSLFANPEKAKSSFVREKHVKPVAEIESDIWEEVDDALIEQRKRLEKKTLEHKKRRRNEWDVEYDRGKDKKFKSKGMVDELISGAFQRAQQKNWKQRGQS